jgi:Flp pilus assembly protein CpaB
MSYKIRHLTIAMVLAVVAALLTVVYATNARTTKKRAAADATVYIAGKDITPGTTAAELARHGYLKTESVPGSVVAPDAITSPASLSGLVARETTYRGEQVTAQRFSPAVEEGVRADLSGKVRAVELSGDSQQLLADTLRAGDKVDVVGTWTLPEGSTHHVAGNIMHGIRVLEAAGGTGSARITDGGNKQNAVTLALTDQQARRLLWIVKNGEWMLSLRPVKHAANSNVGTIAAETLLDGRRTR